VCQHPLDRALLLLGAALPDEQYESLADWPLGRRNRALAELRYACFGSDLQAWAACTECGEKVEFGLDVRTLIDEEPERERGQDVDGPVVVAGRAFRLPTSRDLACAVLVSDPRAAAALLAQRCQLDDAAEAGAPPAWSEDALEEIGERLALADPLAEVRLTLCCPACGGAWVESLDLVAFLWAEVEARARRLLLAVHALATAYGWAEAAILALSEQRRALYLEMVAS
jgi:hypothetical protein